MTRLLLVDDNTIHRKLSEKLFGLYGETTIAASGQEAVDIFDRDLKQNNRFDVVILDMLMPGMDGLETLRRLRALETLNGVSRDKRTKILISSHDTDAELQKTAEAEGCDKYYAKKMSKDDVAKMMAEIGILPKS